MTLIKSISGIRGTLGGEEDKNLTPIDVVKYVSSYGKKLKKDSRNPKVAVGRDGRISGIQIIELVKSTLSMLGITVYDIDLTTTPTTQLFIIEHNLDGGIILTASHNPGNWNALKLFNSNGEFLSKSDGEEVINNSNNLGNCFVNEVDLGQIIRFENSFDIHIKNVLNLKHVNVDGIYKKKFKVVVDGINSSGGIIIPELLKKLNCEVVKINCNPNGDFSHNPEPLDKNLTDLKNTVIKEKADLGIAVDPDVDRLVFVCEDGVLFGEENTLVACSDFVLSKEKGSTVSNMSSTLGLKDVTERYGCEYFSSKVGEVNVVEMMKAKKAIIGGEGNGGVIYPESHYGRDALVGIVLFLSYLVEKNQKVSMILNSMPSYFMLKEKISLDENVDIDSIFLGIKSTYDEKELDTRDGIKINKKSGWIHLRKSNTEPIIRIYIEAKNKEESEMFFSEIKKIIDTNS